VTLRAVLLLFISIGWWRVPAASVPPKRGLVLGVCFATALVAGLALVSGPVLDVLDVDTETFRIATGLVIIASGAVRMFGVGARVEDYSASVSWLAPFAYPVLIGPETVVVSLSIGADHGLILAVLVALAAAATAALIAKASLRSAAASLLVRAAGVALVVLGVALVFDGLRDI